MMTRTSVFAVGVLAVLGVCATRAEVVTLRGTAAVELHELRAGEEHDQRAATEVYPDTQADLPLQAVARLIPKDVQAAAAAGAQLADPATDTAGNPEEFSINLALTSVDPNVRLTATTYVEEARTVRYSPLDVGLVPPGGTTRLTGRFYLDGALALFAGTTNAGLDGAAVTLRILITQERGGDVHQLYAGTLSLAGSGDEVQLSAGGSFPQDQVLTLDLSGIDETLRKFDVCVFPNLVLSYTYDAPVNEDFTLRARVEIDADSGPGDVGVSAVLGTPVDAAVEALRAVQGVEVEEEMTSAIQRERQIAREANPLPDADADTSAACSPFPLCGAVGLESLLGLVAAWGCRGWLRGGHSRKQV